MVAADPYVIATGRRPTSLHDSARWSNANNNVGGRGAESQRTGENKSDQPFMEHSFLFFETFRKPSR
jgi:hypothetical protein